MSPPVNSVTMFQNSWVIFCAAGEAGEMPSFFNL